MARMFPRVLAIFVAVASLQADSKKSTEDQRVELLRGLTSEYAKVKAALPQSKKPLDFNSDGTYDKGKWDSAGKEFGPAARVGDLIQVTHIEIDKDRIVLVLNGGMKNTKGSFWNHVEIGVGGPMTPVGQPTNAPNGTTIAVLFKDSIGDVTSAELKKILAPVLDFEKSTATQNYIDTVPPEIKKAIEDKKPVEGMDRDQILLALGRPVHKSRETKDGVDFEDWIYGIPPGRMTFVTFAGSKVVRIKETYAGLGGSIAETATPAQ
jgi:hypothetical protein